eukprot:2708664-Rhodomonas_salina.1
MGACFLLEVAAEILRRDRGEERVGKEVDMRDRVSTERRASADVAAHLVVVLVEERGDVEQPVAQAHVADEGEHPAHLELRLHDRLRLLGPDVPVRLARRRVLREREHDRVGTAVEDRDELRQQISEALVSTNGKVATPQQLVAQPR